MERGFGGGVEGADSQARGTSTEAKAWGLRTAGSPQSQGLSKGPLSLGH